MKFTIRVLLPVIGFVAALAIWWVASADSTSLYFPPLSKILEAFNENWLFARVGTDVAPSLSRFALGFLFATIAGVALGVLLGISPRMQRAFRPQLEFLRSTPPVLLLPPSLMLFGTGPEMKVFVIALGTVWPILLATTTGVRSADAVAIDMGRVFGMNKITRLRHVVIPGALPSIIAGLRSALPIALVLMVVTELVASTNGVGFFILQSQQNFDLVNMWSGVLLLGVIGMALNLILGWAERRVQAVVSPTSRGGQ